MTRGLDSFAYRSEIATTLADNAGAVARCVVIRSSAGAAGAPRLGREPRAVTRAIAQMGCMVPLFSAYGLCGFR
jgi:hypothetical protein